MRTETNINENRAGCLERALGAGAGLRQYYFVLTRLKAGTQIQTAREAAGALRAATGRQRGPAVVR